MKVLNVGEKALNTIKEHNLLNARSVFKRAIYLQAENEMVILSSLPIRSDFTINILPEYDDLRYYIKRGELLKVRDLCICTEKEVINLNSAAVYKRANSTNSFYLPSEEEIRSFGLALALLYGAADSRLIIDDTAFLGFTSCISEGIEGEIGYERIKDEMIRMVGRGTGFTPYCDDFLAGFLFAFNKLATFFGKRRIFIEREELQRRTIWESSMLIHYAQNGLVDELVYSLLFPNGNKLINVLEEIAKWGHTSGLDTSLGVLFALTSILDSIRTGNQLKSVLRFFGILR